MADWDKAEGHRKGLITSPACHSSIPRNLSCQAHSPTRWLCSVWSVFYPSPLSQLPAPFPCWVAFNLLHSMCSFSWVCVSMRFYLSLSSSIAVAQREEERKKDHGWCQRERMCELPWVGTTPRWKDLCMPCMEEKPWEGVEGERKIAWGMHYTVFSIKGSPTK